MRRLFAIAIIFLAFQSPINSFAGGSADGQGEFSIASIDFSSDGVLTLSVAFQFEEEETLYLWKGGGGHIYPLFGTALFIDITAPLANEIVFTTYEKVMPKFPHPLDTVTTKSFEYPEHLRFNVLKQDGSPFTGCLEFALRYDTASLAKYEAKLSILRLRSNTVTVCNDKQGQNAE